MNVDFSKLFEKQIDLILDKKLKGEIASVVKSVIDADSLQQIHNLKKLKGYKTAYRIRKGNYRIGFVYQNNTVYFLAFAHRRDIYNIFP